MKSTKNESIVEITNAKISLEIAKCNTFVAKKDFFKLFFNKTFYALDIKNNIGILFA